MVISRREWFALSAFTGVSFASPLFDRASAEARGQERAKSLVVIWLQGGPSQLETWDPHPGVPIGGPTRSIPTTVPGIQIAADYPQIAEVLNRFSVIRSLVSKEGDHERATHLLKTGYRPETTLVHPSLVSVAGHECPNGNLDIPQVVSLGETSFPARGGYLGDEWDAFRVFNPGGAVHNLRPNVPDDRQRQRLKGLDIVTQAFSEGRQFQVAKGLHRQNLSTALRIMDSPQIKSFQLDDEPLAVRNAYGRTSFGNGCLVARRLLETGVRAIEVSLPGFDSHAQNFTAHTNRAKDLDPALATLTKELVERDLWQSTMVLVVGEFGRTPKINPLDGRDHWPNGFSCLVGGGGLAAGRLIGATDPAGDSKSPENPVNVADLYATLLDRLGINFRRELATPIGRPMKLSQGEPVAALLPS